ncbi:metal-dependent transcriptional regulator [Desulfothermobacter acidiphilus]|uniref:metal-dependent transcriptional regulator n=1 Tax=Desulfothermobacter acidiphilus TaxID=1938353 RepID=UPI003F8C7EFA
MEIAYSPAAEDYLEAFYLLSLRKKVVRVKDVAAYLGVKMPSVVAAVKSLSEKGLVQQERYGYIELTPTGLMVARQVYERHKAWYSFLSDVLGVDPVTAEKDACRLEHYVSPATLERLQKLVSFVRECPNGARFIANFKEFSTTGERPGVCPGCGTGQKLLSELKAGEKGRVVRVGGQDMLKKRLLGMGLTPGEVLLVKRVAPLGDPIDVQLRNYDLSLRKEEAKLIVVEVV